MKKILLISGVLIFFGLAPHVFAQGFVPLAGIPGLTDTATLNATGGVNQNTLAVFFNNLYKFAIGMAAALAVIMIIWGGLEYATQDSISKKSDGKERIYNAIFGLVLVLSPVLVFSIINPNILNLSINLPELDTRTAPSQPQTTTLPPCGGGRRTNCTPVTPTQETNSDTPITGQYCYMRVDPRVATSPAEYVCASTRALCDNLYNEQIRNDG
ncbi:MAG: pilin, partial [Patescibacteria group bacterium]